MTLFAIRDRKAASAPTATPLERPVPDGEQCSDGNSRWGEGGGLGVILGEVRG
jgi:hypothetical protein